MKLLSKTSLLIITVSIFIFMTGDIVFFHILKHMINKHVTEELKTEMTDIKNKLDKNIETPASLNLYKQISVKQIFKNPGYYSEIKDTVLYNKFKKQFIHNKALSFFYEKNNKKYTITIYKSMLSSNNLIEKITVASIMMVVVFLIMIYILNRFIFVKVWADFFNNLNKVKDYDVNSRKKLKLKESEIDEFNKLNKVLTQMTQRIKADFLNLKELTENTSHEIQTPVAVIKSKAELLLQSENLSENDIELISSILNTSDRLAKLNKSLLLISKIENNQFEENKIINIKEVTEKTIGNFEILLQAENCKLKYEISDLYVKMNPALSEILISNLLKNALMHAENKKEINIKTENNIFEISNTGYPLEFNEKDIFKRFKKNKNSKKGYGLGLEIVKKICDLYKLKIKYEFKENKHIFKIDFSAAITSE